MTDEAELRLYREEPGSLRRIFFNFFLELPRRRRGTVQWFLI